MTYWALVVEDNEALRSVMAELFESMGLKVLTARDGAEALKTLDDFMPDLITLDIHLPDMSGLSVLQHIRQIRGGQRAIVVVVTGDRPTEYADEAALADLFLQKPVGIKDLIALVEKLSFSMSETEPSGDSIRREIKKLHPGLSPREQ